MERRNLPLSIQDFGKLRTMGCVYVDKTEYIKRLLDSGSQYFLSRPRRFGKSLFLSTMKAYFLGKKELFEGLYISGVEKQWLKYPVFHLDFTGEEYTSYRHFYSALEGNVNDMEDVWGKDEREKTLPKRFEGVIKRAKEKTGLGVVILVDEYDKPLLETMFDEKLHERVLKSLKGFYGVLKKMDDCLRFVFITGVTKFSRVSIFSDLNHLTDISLRDDYSGICGLTEKELKDNFQPELKALAEHLKTTDEEAFALLKKNYDGYHFSRECDDMYNPYSVLNTFDARYIEYYWFATATPSYLVQLIKDFRFDPRLFDRNEVEASIDFLSNYRVDSANPVPVMYQSGYLTIKRYVPEYNRFILGYPNEEVKYGFTKNLMDIFSPADVSIMGSFFAGSFVEKLKNGDADGFMRQVKAFFKSIPYDIVDNEKKDESYFQLIFHLMFTMMGQLVQSEVKDADGRADAVVKTADAIYVFEFKMDTSGTAEDAIKQIDTKEYLVPYTADGRKLVKIGAEFSVSGRELARWIII
ncbi:MAG: ATP-binding protein [Tannerella sp.]|jgi:hypothetical protein|nr:ATP-binding protein [Tannerella sp.]